MIPQGHRGGRREHPLDRRAPVRHSSFLRIKPPILSDARQANAMIFKGGFLSALETNTAPSFKNRFFTSQVWHHSLVTEVAAFAPIMAPPTSWMMNQIGRA